MPIPIAEFVSDPELMKGYREWLKNPMTQELLEMAKAHVYPMPLKVVTGENALYYYGINEGANTIIMLLTKMDELVRQQQVAELLAEEPDYGARKIMEERGQLIKEK